MSDNLENLNAQQLKAVEITSGPLLVLAGAGSGKTKVLTCRIANILQKKLCQPWNVLCITFTNKAALEMKNRINSIIGGIAKAMWILTYHSMCVRILRSSAQKIGFSNNFTIYDAADSKRLIKSICADLNIDIKVVPVNTIIYTISNAKNNLISCSEYSKNSCDMFSMAVSKVYEEYQSRLKKANCMDFDDLLFWTYELLKNNNDILEAYQDRFLYLSVDEYQDTNKAQYEITKLLANKYQNIMVVGDDDQSIYSWRGADVENILSFKSDYPNAQIVKLEQNYRSTKNILEAANAVISHNKNRTVKQLFTTGDDGKKIGVYCAVNEKDEGRWIAGEIERRKLRGAHLSDVAIFYRTNAQSRVLEDMLIRAGIPYKIVGGVKFFERSEIKNVVSYLSLLINPNDDIACKRVINVPKRGIGKTTISYIDSIAKSNDCSFFNALKIAVKGTQLRPTTSKSISEFINIIDKWIDVEAKSNSFFQNSSELKIVNESNLRQRIQDYIEDVGLISALKAEHTFEADGRIENIEEFFGVCDEFCQTHEKDHIYYDAPNVAIQKNDQSQMDQSDVPQTCFSGNSLKDFLEWVSLRTDLDSIGTLKEDDNQNLASLDLDAVTLMTVHSAKGLEFDYVFVAGMEEKIFPHVSAFMDVYQVEEERRLAYVAITRAKKELLLTYAQSRVLYGKSNNNSASRFILEIPNELITNLGVGSLEYSGFGWDKRGDRHGVAGSGLSTSNSIAGKIDFFGNQKTLDRGSSFFETNKTNKPSQNEVYNNSGNTKLVLKSGDMINHKVFGLGRVTKVRGDKIHVTFTKTNQNKIFLNGFTPITKVN